MEIVAHIIKEEIAYYVVSLLSVLTFSLTFKDI